MENRYNDIGKMLESTLSFVVQSFKLFETGQQTDECLLYL